MSPAVFIDANVPSYVMHRNASVCNTFRQNPLPQAACGPGEGADLTTPLP